MSRICVARCLAESGTRRSRSLVRRGVTDSRLPDSAGIEPATSLRSRRNRQTLDRFEGSFQLFVSQREVDELAGEVVVVGGHVEMTVTGEVEEDRALDAGLVGGPRLLQGAVDCVCGLGSREDALAAGECHGGSEDVVLEVGLGSNQAVAYELRNE